MSSSADQGCKGHHGCPSEHNHEDGSTRRDFLTLTAGAMGAVGAASVAWPLVQSMNPAADTLAMATTEVDLSNVKEGQAITVVWRGKPVFIRRRTQKEIDEARAATDADLKDPQSDQDRVKQSKFNGKDMPEWLIMVGVCTHLGCVPLGQKPTDPHGEFDGWFCPCHGSQYDSSGRIRKGPAPKNLEIPPYTFTDNNKIKIG
ncbi:MAG: ubiquinol-cytochrome c reductase iron-sulfur subunit [Alphaproteobacteria bacterium]|nr:ubiquinol-cytochrome c reductase iron-sulfur subunit [Alphaproteobacteria bacterium]MBV8548189.1 ubiquinol-cytochrome c reductase iron-sulfur subunit [Alphaproteobacteria bacterium]